GDAAIGSSARAEIDLGCCRRPAQSYGFLRTRGDRPALIELEEAMGMVPPHARRSTQLHECPVEHHPGSSARAEIDPARMTTTSSRTRFLRTRGDRPRPRSGS